MPEQEPGPHRSLGSHSTHLTFPNTPHRAEYEPLLRDQEQSADNGSQLLDSLEKAPVYTTIHRIRRDVRAAIDDPYSLELLRSPRMNTSVVRPLVDRLYDMQDISVVYCLLVNRAKFLREQSYQAHHSSVNITRALLCEVIATRILRRYDEDHAGPKGLLLLAHVLVAGFEPFQNAPAEVIQEYHHTLPWVLQKRTDGRERVSTALEVAIISESKLFLASSACQKVVDAIYKGKVTFTPISFVDILPDHYKYKPIELYDPRKARLLNQYRLVVPRTRNILEICHFIILLVLYVLTMVNRNGTDFTLYEAVFSVYALGWVLDQFASVLEHGWEVYTQNLWSFLDTMFAIIYFVYLFLRMHGSRISDPRTSEQALEVLSIAAPILVPRLAFNFMSENILFVSLRAMMSDFIVLTFLAVWCFAGFLVSLKWLHGGSHHRPITISKWMLWVWFGLDATGIQRSVEFHRILGPMLMVAFAFLGNTLFLTILVSMLSTTFSSIVANATAEIQYRRAVLTFEGVKSDAIFAYPPPFNILALLVFLPLKFLVSPRWFHKLYVAAVRAINAPVLLLIAAFERKALWATNRRRAYSTLRGRSLWDIPRFSVHGDIQAVFEAEPPREVLDGDDDSDDGVSIDTNILDHAYLPSSASRKSTWASRGQKMRPRKDSVGVLSERPSGLFSRGEGEGVAQRLEALEASVKRVEELLGKMSGDSGDGGDAEDVDSQGLGSPGLAELDKHYEGDLGEE